MKTFNELRLQFWQYISHNIGWSIELEKQNDKLSNQIKTAVKELNYPPELYLSTPVSVEPHCYMYANIYEDLNDIKSKSKIAVYSLKEIIEVDFPPVKTPIKKIANVEPIKGK